MSPAAIAGQPQLRVIRRQSIRPSPRLALRLIRPSLLDGRIGGDPWIVPRGEEELALCFDDRPLVRVRGLALDLPALNELFHRLRYRRPRRARSRWESPSAGAARKPSASQGPPHQQPAQERQRQQHDQ